MDITKTALPLAELKYANQIVQHDYKVGQDGSVTGTLGTRGMVQNVQGTPFAADEFIAFKQALTEALTGKPAHAPGTIATSFGSESGAVVANTPDGKSVVLKEIDRSPKPGGKDVISYLDSPATKKVIDMVAAHLPGPITFKDANGVEDVIQPQVMPSDLKVG